MRGFLRSVLMPSEGWLSVMFSLAVILSSVSSVQAAAWVEKLGILTWIAVVAVFSGYILSRIRLPSLALHIVALLFGAALVVFWTASTLPTRSLRSGLNELWTRFDHWLTVTLQGGVSTDNLLFLLLMSGVVWLLGYFGSWSIFRSRGPWSLILGSGAVLVINLSYAQSLDWFALVYLVTSMALIARVTLTRQEESWRRSGVQYASDFPWRVLSTSILAGTVVIVAVWMGPELDLNRHWSSVWSRISGPWQSAESQFSRYFGGVRSNETLSNSAFGKTLSLRGASPLGDGAVLAVSEQQAMYLRGVVYDQYNGQGWLAPEGSTQQLQPNDGRLMPEGYASREEVTVNITVLQPRGVTVLAPALPVRIGLQLDADFEADASSGTPVGFTTARSTMMLRRGMQYGAVASVSRATAKDLREAGTDYPAWIRERYLALPRSIPRRVLVLARSIAANAKNPYDQALAMESYLRSYRYSESVPAPPGGRDAVDYFLFDLKIGYCDYYASAMVVALRSLGVPARVVSGYAPGNYDRAQQVAIVRDSDAHSWPEVYFARYGWIPFEPTASRPPLAGPVEPPGAEPTPFPTPVFEPEDVEMPRVPPESKEAVSSSADRDSWEVSGIGGLVRGIVAVVAFGGLLYLAALVTWRHMFRGQTLGTSAYGRMLTIAGWLGVGRPKQETPHEYGRRLARLVPDAEADVQLIVDQFVRERFGRKELSRDEAHSIQRAWLRLRGRLIRLVLRRGSRIEEE